MEPEYNHTEPEYNHDKPEYNTQSLTATKVPKGVVAGLNSLTSIRPNYKMRNWIKHQKWLTIYHISLFALTPSLVPQIYPGNIHSEH